MSFVVAGEKEIKVENMYELCVCVCVPVIVHCSYINCDMICANGANRIRERERERKKGVCQMTEEISSPTRNERQMRYE